MGRRLPHLLDAVSTSWLQSQLSQYTAGPTEQWCQWTLLKQGFHKHTLRYATTELYIEIWLNCNTFHKFAVWFFEWRVTFYFQIWGFLDITGSLMANTKGLRGRAVQQVFGRKGINQTLPHRTTPHCTITSRMSFPAHSCIQGTQLFHSPRLWAEKQRDTVPTHLPAQA